MSSFLAVSGTGSNRLALLIGRAAHENTTDEPAPIVNGLKTVEAYDPSILSGEPLPLRNESEPITLTHTPTIHFHAFLYELTTES